MFPFSLFFSSCQGQNRGYDYFSAALYTSLFHTLGHWDFEHPWNRNHQLIISDLSTKLKQSQTAEKLKLLFKAQSLSVLI